LISTACAAGSDAAIAAMARSFFFMCQFSKCYFN
jgi:hypothetical protein